VDTEAPARPRPRALTEGPVEWTCKIVSEVALIVMLVLVAIDIVTRSLLNFSFEVSDEVGGYMLVVICFFSLATCQANHAFHEVEFVQARLSPLARSVSQLVFGTLSLAAAILLAWQFARFEVSSWRFGDLAPTYLSTPLWLPRLAMVIGMTALCLSLVRTVVIEGKTLRRLLSMRERHHVA
jgi:TRAP-type C4-dicarboxylate transport system permease small subunit